MAKDPAFLFYSSDFLSGIADLTMEERGQYITLLCLQHQKGNLTEKTIKIAVPNISIDVLNKFTKDENGNYFNKRLSEEISKRKIHSERQRENVLKRWNKTNDGNTNKDTNNIPKKYNGNTMVIPLENEDVNKNINVIEVEIYPAFEDFWDLYDKKRGDKDKVKIKWDKLSQKTKEDIMAYIPDYKISQPDKKYRKDPITFLNNKSWNDELIFNNNGKQLNTEQQQAFKQIANSIRESNPHI